MLFVITNSQLCKDDFLLRLESIAISRPDRIILREKHLSENEYTILAKKCMDICSKYNVLFSVNTFVNVAEKLNIPNVHIPLFMLEDNPLITEKFKTVGVSVHNVEEAKTAEKLKASYIIAGHIFETNCKKGLAPRGLGFLQSVKSAVSIPVLAIGGIGAEQIPSVINTGADGVCVMSYFMKCTDVENEVLKLKKSAEKYQ